MSLNISFEMSESERHSNSISTILNMLIARRWIEDDFDKYYNKIFNSRSADIPTSHVIECIDKKVAIKFYNSKINSLKNDREIDIFMTTYPDTHKILIVNDISPKAEKQIFDSSNFEVFKSNDIIRDISRHHLVPRHILLSPEEATSFVNEYKLAKKDMGRIYIDDPMCRYLYAQKDDIIQIIRENVNSGYSTYYRLVVPGSIYN